MNSPEQILTGLSALLRNAMFIFTLTNPVESILGRGLRFRERPRSPLRPILRYATPFLEVNRTRTNTNPNDTEANAAGRSVRACVARKSKS